MKSWLKSRRKPTKQRVFDHGAGQDADASSSAAHSATLRSTDGPGELATSRLGLQTVYSPSARPRVDIIFVHGLGGTSRGTWTLHKDPSLFWPGSFLPFDVSEARIHTFGYRADLFKSNKSSVLDFAKELLFEMKYSKDQEGMDVEIGAAYLQGQHDPEYCDIIRAVKVMVFMATPHRGADLAETLNRIIQATCIHSPKAYISDLARNSNTVQRINESFRHYAVPGLQIMSFYETKATAIGQAKMQVTVVSKDSAVLGYPGETSRGLDADHNSICKYSSPQDPNYIAVRNYLQSAIAKMLAMHTEDNNSSNTARADAGSRELEALFRITESPDNDFIFFRDRWTSKTSDWIFRHRTFQDWSNSTGPEVHPKLLWVQGLPGSGKSVLASFIINHLVETGQSCQYFFVRCANQSKRSLRTILNHLAYQIALANPQVSRALGPLLHNLQSRLTDSRYIWQHVYKNVILKQYFSSRMYWIIDGLEECDDPRGAARILSEMLGLDLPIPIRILITSRPTVLVESELGKIEDQGKVHIISLENQNQIADFRMYIRNELLWDDVPEFHRRIAERLLTMAGNSFLWLSLTVERINGCHTEESVEHVLNELPPDMEELYARMAIAITQHNLADRELAVALLVWIACARRNLTIIELEDAMSFKKGHAHNLQRSLGTLCGGFAVTGGDGMVSLVHQTAGDFLLSDLGADSVVNISPILAHQKILLRCLQCLTTPGLRTKVTRNQQPPLFPYAITFWANHLAYCDPSSDEVLSMVGKFLGGPAILVWIQELAKGKSLEVLLQASVHLSVFCRKRRTMEACRVPDERTPDVLELLETWSTELGRIVGKFGTRLTHLPESIFGAIAPFCPKNSIFRKQFLDPDTQSISVSTTSTSDKWGDGVGMLPLGVDDEATALIAEGPWLAVLYHHGDNNNSSVALYHSSTHEKHLQLEHGGRVRRIQMNALGTLLVTCGLVDTKIWDTSSGICVRATQNPPGRPRPQTIVFSEDDECITIGTDDKRCWSIDLREDAKEEWQEISQILETRGQGGPVNSPTCMKISPDGCRVAMGYRLRALSVWDVDSSELVAASHELMRATHIVWHPDPSILEIFGIMLHLGGRVFKWQLEDVKPTTLDVEASSIAINHDGSLLALGDQHGHVKLLNTADLGFVYYMAAQDAVISVAFSMDSRYLYDLRYSHSNIWQPNVLLKIAETTSQPSDGGIDVERALIEPMWDSSEVPEYSKIDPITALSAQHGSNLFAFGTREGTVQLFQKSGHKLQCLHQSPNYFGIQEIAWSDDGATLCFADVSRNVHVQVIDKKTRKASTLFECRPSMLEDNIEQLLFNAAGDKLLVASQSTAAILCMSEKKIVSMSQNDIRGGRFMRHFHHDELIAHITPWGVTTIQWTDLSGCSVYGFGEGDVGFLPYGDCADAKAAEFIPPQMRRGADLKVTDVLVAQNNSSSYLIICVRSSENKTFLRLVRFLQDAPDHQYTVIALPVELGHRMRCPLMLEDTSSLSETLVFLDVFGWVSTWPLGEYGATIQRPGEQQRPATIRFDSCYCLPDDWTGPGSYGLLKMVDRNILLCPKDGEVAIVEDSSLET
ncbi:hypothetical protein QQS21_004864 [Conoideocrella luteorostrata]|uniref:NACHT domain-containing protein n=1 Tax=Conoideocrella luteorostrata TaxID=1105319 RepID=A0AAJ0FZH3_9HYPO|nr:hypothetical protein QQS21_004864 [Conoideocrella luteorostrata]